MTGPDSMKKVLAVVGEEASLCVESDERVEGKITVSFEARDGESHESNLDQWNEDLVANVVPYAKDPPFLADIPPFRSRILWTVNMHGSTAMPDTSRTVFFKVTLPGHPEIVSQNYLWIPGLKITDNELLKRIMVHEFAIQQIKNDGTPGDAVFDPSPLKAVLDDLTAEQRKLLTEGTVVGSEGHRLVCFVTLQPRPSSSVRMHADTTQFDVDVHVSLQPNATFTVFDCQGPGKDVALVCHTNYFVLNMLNNATYSLILKQNGNKLLSRKTRTPPIFKIGSFPKGIVIYNRIFNSNGEDAINKDTIHGMINTDGCWMIFRNYNWPKSAEDDFDKIYIHEYRSKDKNNSGVEKRVAFHLAILGYDCVKPDSKHCTSLDKFRYYDKNCAYLWFLRDIVGIKYYADMHFVQRIGLWDQNPKTLCHVHNHNTNGLLFENTLDLSEVESFVNEKGDDQKRYVYHDAIVRRSHEHAPQWQPGNDIWTKNALGFKTAGGFVPTPELTKLNKEQIDTLTWGDVYLYRADSLDKIERSYTIENAPADPLRISLVLYYENSLDPITNCSYRLYLYDCEVKGSTDDSGFMEYNGVPAGDYHLEIAGGETFVPAIPPTTDRLGWMVLGAKP